jgi:CRISPR/Cas system CSM-associated protein Csm3 (group 7 of RAMP superfamily)
MMKLEVTASLATPLNIGSGAQRGTLADRAMLKDEDGWPYIPASALKGVLRHAVEQIAAGLGQRVCITHQDMCPHQGNYCIVCEVFGSPGKQGKLYFERLTLVGPPEVVKQRAVLQQQNVYPTTTQRYGVAISRRRGVAENALLYTTELLKPGTALQFGGTLEGTLETGEIALVLAGFRSLTALGRGKTGGLGWLEEITWKLSGTNTESLQTPAGIRAVLEEVTG